MGVDSGSLEEVVCVKQHFHDPSLRSYSDFLWWEDPKDRRCLSGTTSRSISFEDEGPGGSEFNLDWGGEGGDAFGNVFIRRR